MECNKLDAKLRKYESLAYCRNALLNVGQATFKPIYNTHIPIRLKLLTGLRLGLSHLNEHKFKHNFQDYINPLCTFGVRIPFPFLSAVSLNSVLINHVISAPI